MTEHNLEDSIALLARTPASLDALLRGLPDLWTLRNEGGDSWTAYDVIGHLNHCERADWMPRARIILDHGDTRPFEPLDRLAQFEESRGKTLEQLLDEFAELRAANLNQLRSWNLSSADLEKRGRHPAFGSVTLSQLIAAWPVHDLSHIHQISRILAHQYCEPIGPWGRFLGVMQCNGHSALA
ncbi:MAG: DinB family protein [Acidobacteriaceae bacterium]